jgi:DNA processing protein
MTASTIDLEQDLPFWIALTRISGIGPRRFDLLLQAFGSAQAVWDAPPGRLAASGLDRRTLDALVRMRPRIDPALEIQHLRSLGATAIARHDPRYPRLLAEIYDPPPVLYVRSELTPQEVPLLSIVGTRGATGYGRMAAERLASGVADAGVTVVSGLAYGIDAAAHRGALEAGGCTIAVLGSGLDRIYPSQHARLAQQIVQHGAVITEFPLGTKPDARNFPQRNRIVSGLSFGTLVVEAGERSGALITAAFAAEQGRDVMAVPGSIYSPASQGTNRLIRDGAIPITGVEDILLELEPQRSIRPMAAERIVPADDTEAALLGVLGAEPLHIDEIARAASLPMSVVSSGLAIMELKGMARQTGGMNYVRGIDS